MAEGGRGWREGRAKMTGTKGKDRSRRCQPGRDGSFCCWERPGSHRRFAFVLEKPTKVRSAGAAKTPKIVFFKCETWSWHEIHPQLKLLFRP